ncbi:glutamyl-tRNA(Gln) amidotransferase subunit B, mitochondrial-like [Anneissia japonica]|uniref:glutamyl-tRNA(Gln) amidotransferase subunit B, mitochondrial-like n=1 Tax=Anneissia japonica TaxID=1529436 RepID=UPI0014258F88|nr:glutamyl-tRNA(Gln) amidotransferase subunit B, mitochondrial-like [Anneissia japonica]
MTKWSKFNMRINRKVMCIVNRFLHQDCSSVWESVVGLEIHAQINSHSKLFSGAGTKFMVAPNSQVAFFDAALPGTLPVLNRRCVEAAIFTGLALSCTINRVSFFDRKHYFYADMPAGYQITQNRVPIAIDGKLQFPISSEKGNKTPIQKTVHVRQIQLEQDSGKSLHDDDNQQTLVDLNRAGMGLMEIVTEPNLRNGLEAAAMVRELQLILQTIKTCNAKMEEGSLRVDANISVNLPGQPFGTRAEVKNINSIRNVKNAIDYEIARQIRLLEEGIEIVADTRYFDVKLGKTVSMRDKETSLDYRFMLEPNLPPLRVYDDDSIEEAQNPSNAINIDNIGRSLPELPEAKRLRFIKQYKISSHSAVVLVSENELGDFFEKVMTSGRSLETKKVADWLINDLSKVTNQNEITVSQCSLTPDDFADIVQNVSDGVISAGIGRQLLNLKVKGDSRSVTEIIEVNDWKQLTDRNTIQDICLKVIQENPEQVQIYRSGNKKVIHRLMGVIQKKTGGKIQPQLAISILETLLDQDT